MPKRKKPARELTRDEMVHRVFPKPVVKELKRIATNSKKVSSRKS